MPSFGKLYKQLLELGSQDTGGDAESIAKNAVVRVYQRILDVTNQNQAAREFTLTTNTSFSQYGLPLYVDTIKKVIEPTGQREIVEMTHGEYKNRLPGNVDTGDPEFYYAFGDYGVQLQPSASGTVGFTSDSALDTTTTYVTVSGYDANGVLDRETVTMTGTVKASTTKSFTTIERVVKSEDDGTSWIGNLTVTDAASNVLARIPSFVESPTYRWIEFYFKPGSVLTYTISCNAFKPALVDDTDWPEIDEKYHDLLLLGGSIICFPVFGKGDQVADIVLQFNDRLDEYKELVDPSPNLILHMTDVTMGTALPRRPWIPGVDRGIVSA
jgi:hypothetical protein